MPGENVTVYERSGALGGCRGISQEEGGHVCPGEREMMADMECLWYLCSKIPSLDAPGRTVLDETVDANKAPPIHSECRCIKDQGHIWEQVHDYRMDPETMKKLQAFLMEPEKNLEDISIEDYVFATCGSMMTNACFGDNTHVAETNRDESDMGLFTLWKNLAAKDEKFGHPEKILGKIDQTKWTSFFLTVKDCPELFDRLEQKTGSPRGTGGCVTIMDSGWEISFMAYDRDYFPGQETNNEDVTWSDGLFGERQGNCIKNPTSAPAMRFSSSSCTTSTCLTSRTRFLSTPTSRPARCPTSRRTSCPAPRPIGPASFPRGARTSPSWASTSRCPAISRSPPRQA